VSLHTTFQYLKYRFRARGRHGVHSPFVYDFVENVLRGKGVKDAKMIAFLRSRGFDPVRLPAIPGQLRAFTEQTVFVLSQVHADAKQTAAWSLLAQMPQVTLSIDLYDTGLVFFHPDFKVKQHFVLR
jgi:hypothetical protein